MLLSALAVCLACTATAQTADQNDSASGYEFTDVKLIPTTPVKDQSRSGTCWCFSTLSFLESEILKAGGPEMHLSEMWIVRHSFMDKAEKYIRLHGEPELRRGRRFARRDGGHQGPRHRSLRGLSGPELRNRETRFPRAVGRAQSLPRRRAQGRGERQAPLDGLETRLQRPPRRVLRPDARNVHLRGQGVHARIVRRIAADRHGKLRGPLVVHAPSLLHALHHRGSRQLDVGARFTTCRSRR